MRRGRLESRHAPLQKRCVSSARALRRAAVAWAAYALGLRRMLGKRSRPQRVLHTYSWDEVAFMSHFVWRLRGEYVCTGSGRAGSRR
ncbi:hypothetical protein AZ78_2520 [Lysobacter capsici AZ78]|uniref:Uncharacterized protein n=1 Tax=Lysobacter capsici AZ78 TaxID=1444315 RepID=A0A120AGQ7_9GAMM|nr:hypothetical protein AZ78_2520 [Lysobacter capsici AZ78]